VELVPGGREVAVTDANKLAYIHRVADFRLNTQLVGCRSVAA
jgi:HECT-domain (ubiquitin-transferase)